MIVIGKILTALGKNQITAIKFYSQIETEQVG